MPDFAKFFKGELAKIIVSSIDQKISGQEIMSKLDLELDKMLGSKVSERIQRKHIANLLKEMLFGLYEEDPEKLKVKFHNWMQEIDKINKEGQDV